MTQFPSSITAFSTKTNGQIIDSSDVNNVQNEVTALETKVGIDNSSVTTSLDYLVKNGASNGGGHIQTANKGGTGQVSYVKGDLLIGASASVLSKLAIGADGTSPVADSSQSTGISWATVSATLPYAQDSGTGSVYAISPVPCIVSLSPGQIFVTKITNTNTGTSPALSVSSLVARKIVNLDGSSILSGQIKSSSLSLFGYDGSASVIQLLNPTPPWTYIVTTAGNGGTGTTISVPANANFAIITCSATGSNISGATSFVVARNGATAATFNSTGQSSDASSSITVTWSGSTITINLSIFTTSNNTAYFYT